MPDQSSHESKSPDKRARRGGLGRGLGSLIPTGASDDYSASSAAVSALQTLPLDAITANPFQPRTHMDPGQLEDLAASIRRHGLMQPVIVSENASGGYRLIAGERRWRASKLAGLESIEAIVRNAAGQELLELAIIENVVRADLSPLEEALAYKQLIEDFGMTQSDVADRIGRSRVSVTNTLRLLGAPDRVREALARGEITEGHTRAILGLGNAVDQLAILDEVVKRGLNVRQTEALVRKWQVGERRHHVDQTARDDDEIRLEDRLRTALGTRVELKRAGPGAGGILTIQFFTDDQLQAFYDKVVGEDIW